MKTAVLYYQSDVDQFLIDKPVVGKIYPLTPDAKAALLGKTDLTMLDPLDFFTDYSHRRVIASVRSIERKIHPLIQNDKILSRASKETLISLMHVSLSSCFYLLYLLRGTGPWLLYDGNSWVRVEKLDTAVNILFKRIVLQKTGVFQIGQNKDQIGKTFIKLFNWLILIKIKNNQCFWTTGQGYGLNNITENLLTVDRNNKVLYAVQADRKSLFRSLKSVISLYTSFSQRSFVLISPVREPVSDYMDYLDNLFETTDDSRLKPFIIPLKLYLNKCIVYTESLVDDTKRIIKNIGPKKIIAHHLRWLDASIVGHCASELGIDTILISHGSHPPSENVTSEYELNDLARGLFISPLAAKSIAQSTNAAQSINSKSNVPKIINYQPIMWGWGNLGSVKRTNKKFQILHAGTYKVLGVRPWIYETSNEFVHGLQQFVQAVSSIEDIDLIIRIRSLPECDISSLEKLLPNTDNCQIKTGGSFQDDLSDADLLVSYSSTTIEEALYARKPVALFGGSDRYRHLPGSSTLPDMNNRSAVYHLTKENMSEMLEAIIAVHSNKPLTDSEVSDYVWPDSVPGIDTFVSNLIKKEENGHEN
ncbi:MAG: hypothetical protein H8D45_30705 [Bacteroidetes bacterium]|nr:hypothetical protein [Bacteroidota bacterium]